MRLHRLSVTAFGPFVDTTEVDFDALSDAGLFLLSGATGSGKSSVLDAVCFALYGAVPGDRNHAGRLRCDQAPAGLVPQVSLEVTLGARRFRLVRSPAHDRPKKRGSGTTREPSKVTVSEHVDATWVPLTSRLDEAGDLVGGLLGMNLDQFCQVALLPQGQFQAFLRADSQARQALLAKLFRTRRFERMEVWLRERRLALRRTSDRHRAEVADLVSRLSEVAGASVPDELDDVAGAGAAGSVAAWLRALRDDAAARRAAADEQCRALAHAEAGAREHLESAQQEATARARVSDAATTLHRLRADDERHQEDVTHLDRAGRAAALRPLVALVDERAQASTAMADRAAASRAALGWRPDGAVPWEPTLAAALDEVTAELAAATALLPAERRLADLRSQVDGRLLTLRELGDADALETAEAAALEGRVDQLATDLAEAEAAGLGLPEATVRLSGLQAVVAALEDLGRIEADLTPARVDHAAAVDRVLDRRGTLLDLREQRIAGMAAELAGALVAGDDCPVCGSAEHPHPAQAATGHPDAAAERAAQHAVDDAQAFEAAAAMRVRDLETALATCREVVGERDAAEVRRALATAQADHGVLGLRAGRRPALAEGLAEARHRGDALAEAARSREVAVVEATASLAHLREEMGTLEAAVDAARGADPALVSVVERLEARRTALREAYDDAAAHELAALGAGEAATALGRAALEAGFHTADEARASTLTDAERAALEQRVRQHESALVAAEAVLAEPGSEALLAGPEPDVAQATEAHRSSADALERGRGTAASATRRQARITSLAAELERAQSDWEPVRDELRLVTAVSSFAEGRSADNRLQMRLSAYVLAHRLSQVVAAANARLTGMSDRRYSLEHVGRRGAGETRGGLSLAVRDDWSGESRDPATLSGGETFVVSLALALGLADVVAHEAGGADLATLFVDEGFGSLDAETLDDVIDILDTLREGGRAVGVVSHVAEMRHRIPTQLVVTKARTGSTVHLAGVTGPG